MVCNLPQLKNMLVIFVANHPSFQFWKITDGPKMVMFCPCLQFSSQLNIKKWKQSVHNLPPARHLAQKSFVPRVGRTPNPPGWRSACARSLGERFARFLCAADQNRTQQVFWSKKFPYDLWGWKRRWKKMNRKRCSPANVLYKTCWMLDGGKKWCKVFVWIAAQQCWAECSTLHSVYTLHQ